MGARFAPCTAMSAYRFVESESMLNVLTAHESAVRACLARDRQVAIVFDSLAALKAEKESLAMWCEDIGVSLPERLSLNSIDDSTRLCRRWALLTRPRPRSDVLSRPPRHLDH